MIRTRLSSAASLVRAWLSSRRSLAAQHAEALAECRRLKGEYNELKRAVRVLESDHDKTIDNLGQRIQERREENDRLAAMVSDLERELAVRQQQVDRLESQVQLDREEIKRLTDMHKCQSVMVERLIAEHVAISTRTTVGMPVHEQNGFDEYLK